MNNEQEGEISGQTGMLGNIRCLLLLRVLSGSLKSDCTLAGYENMDWDRGAKLEKRMHWTEFDERDDISCNQAQVLQKGPWDLGGWEFHSQIIKPWQRKVLEAT